MTPTEDARKVLVCGATGYVGSRLVPVLLERGYLVRASGRSLEKLQARSWANHPSVELVEMDMTDPGSVQEAVSGCTHVIYLVHSMNPQNSDFEEADRAAAQNMVEAVNQFRPQQLIYLGGLGEMETQLSKHLRSRAEVGSILRTAEVPVTVLRAAMIIGSGSASFEILRYLVDRLPIMVTPRWVHTPSQPIAIRNVLEYLIGCLENGDTYNKVLDIGGPEIISYSRLMQIYAEETGLPRRKILPVPVFTPRLSSYWINFVTPVPAYIARPLAEGLRNPAVCQNNEIQKLIPQDLLPCREAIRRAVQQVQHHIVASHWTDAGKMPPAEWCTSDDPCWAGGTTLVDIRRTVIQGSADDAWRAISRIGGRTGWYYADWLWRIRGAIDRLIGGVGLRRGRRHPEELRPGDALDFWRVSAVMPPHQLLLIAEMKLPGQAALQFLVKRLDDNQTEITQIARFLPRGLVGILYWYAVMPLHELVFNGMLRGIARASQRQVLVQPEYIGPPLPGQLILQGVFGAANR